MIEKTIIYGSKPGVTQEQSKKITGGALFLLAALISFGGLATFFALWPNHQ